MGGVFFTESNGTTTTTEERAKKKGMLQQQRSKSKCEGIAMGFIALDLRPGLGLGPFSLGMPICEAFAQIEQQPNIYDVVHVKYLDEEPLKLDIVISFPDHGFHLHFDPWSQRGPSTLATFVAVYATFGPTYPGIYDKVRGGLSFAFPIPSQYTNCCSDGEVALPLEFPDGTTPVTCRVSIYDSSAGRVGIGSLVDKASAPPLPAGSLYMEEVHVKLGEELYFAVGGQHIPFGASLQDVWTELGRPCGIHQKQVDQMVIHSASDPRPRTTLCGDYFYNYFTRGLDILFDGQAHKIKKFVLHTNYPGHADFNLYIKCNFVIYNSGFGGSFHQEVNACITPSTKWEQVKEILGDCGRAAIQTQGSKSNPFGSTFVYGYQNVAFEVSYEEWLYCNCNSLPVMRKLFYAKKIAKSPPGFFDNHLPQIRVNSSISSTKMTLSGLAGSPSRFHLLAQGRGSHSKSVSAFPDNGKLRMLTYLQRNNWAGSIKRCSIRKTCVFKCAMDASFGDAANDPTAIFPRINIRDPYKRLGISREASEDEIQAARNFLMQRYGGHKPSVDAIESAHDKIIMQKFYERKNPKIDIKKKVRVVTQSRVVQAVTSRFRTPSKNFIIKTSAAFVVLGALTFLFPTEEGPTLQVVGAFIFSWLVGTFLMVSVIPPIIKGPRSLEVATSLITYVLLWVSSTYLK
ncbi:unnamed protein product [Camellia sinensis]